MIIKDVEITNITILESLISGPKPELKTGKILADELSCSHLKSITSFKTIYNRKELFDALTNIESNVTESDGVLLFLEFHGSEEGIKILDEYNKPEILLWYEITSYLVNINKKTAIGLVIVFSCCFGIWYFTQATIRGIAAYHLMFGCNEKIYNNELLNINKKLISGFTEEKNIDILVSECNEYIKGTAIYSCIDLHEGLINAFKECLLNLFDNKKLSIRISNLVKNLPSDYPQHLYPEKLIKDKILSREYNETKYNELRDRMFLADKHLLYHRYYIDFGDLCTELGIEDKFTE